MSVESQQRQTVSNQPELMVSDHQINSKPWRWEPVFKVISYVLYGFLFGMLPASFKLSKAPSQVAVNPVEVSGIIAVLGISCLSITLVFWIFKGEVKRHMAWGYHSLHIFNAISLLMGVIIINFFPIATSDVQTSDLYRNINLRQIILASAMLVHVILISAGISIFFYHYKKLFPLTWSRICFAQGTLILSGFTNLLVFMAGLAQANEEKDNMQMLLFVSLFIFVLAFILFIFALAYIRVYRDILLGERTDLEIETINNWENAKSLALIGSSVAAVTFIIASYWNKVFLIPGALVWVDFAINLVLFGIYLSMLIVAKIQQRKQLNAPMGKYRFLKMFKSIDNIFLLEVIIWTILAKSIIIEGVMISNAGSSIDSALISSLYLNSLICFIFVFLLYILGPIFALDVPNIKNMWISLSTIISGALLVILTIVFTNIFSSVSSNAENPVFLPIFMLITLSCGMSISLILRTIMVGQIFRPEFKVSKINHHASKTKQINFDQSDDETNQEEQLASESDQEAISETQQD